jgi:hypothetical protein
VVFLSDPYQLPQPLLVNLLGASEPALQLFMVPENLLLRWGEDTVEPTQHGQRQDYLLVLALLVVVP